MAPRENHWQIDFKDIAALEQKMKQIPGRSEDVINDVLHNKVIQKASDAIRRRIPVSTWEDRVRQKKHARDDKKPHTPQKQNLAFTLRPKKKLEYLKYPDLGIGQSQYNPPEHFMKKGLEAAAPDIIADLNKAIDDELNKILGG